MKIVLYIILAIVLIVIAIFIKIKVFSSKISEIKIHAGTTESQRIQIIDDWFTHLQKENKFNGVVLIGEEGQAKLAKGYGFTDYKRDKKLNENSSLRLASISKQFTAAGVMLLRQKEKIKFDDLVSKYIVGFPYKNVTIRNLLNQTSGIPDIYLELAERDENEIDLLTNQIAVELIIKENKPADAEPDQEFQYSNTNYIILARIIEIVSELSFEDYMQKEIFIPLGMENTRVWNLRSKESTFENKADDFINDKGQTTELKPTFIDGVAGDGAVFSSALDMLKWDGFWYKSSLLEHSILSEAFKKPMLNNGKRSDYGFGWVLSNSGMWHNGAWQGARTMFIRNTNKKRCFAILDNSSTQYIDPITDQLEAAFKDK